MVKPDCRLFGRVPGTTTALLSAPSKMPGYSWSLPAHRSCPRANGDICADCYAEKGFYAKYPTVRRAQEARFVWTRESVKTVAGRAHWVETMVRAINKTGTKYFRVHDSGDMFCWQYAQCWQEVCQCLPRVKFWIPTRAWQIPAGLLNPFRVLDNADEVMRALQAMARLDNVTVRPSALNFGDRPPVVNGLHAGTAADCGTVRACHAHRQDNQCKSCRACWTMKDTEISYTRH